MQENGCGWLCKKMFYSYLQHDKNAEDGISHWDTFTHCINVPLHNV